MLSVGNDAAAADAALARNRDVWNGMGTTTTKGTGTRGLIMTLSERKANMNIYIKSRDTPPGISPNIQIFYEKIKWQQQ